MSFSVKVREDGVEHVTIDEETLDALRKLGLGDIDDEHPPAGGDPKTAEEILDSIRARIEQRLREKDDPRYTSLAERLDKLRQTQLVVAADSIEFLKHLLEVARDLVAVDRETAEEEAAETGQTVEEVMDSAGLLPEERRGALTQIFEEYKPEVAPEILERVVAEIDAVVMGSRFTRWQTSREGERTVKTEIRKALKKFGLPATGELFERAYNYVAENY